MLRKQQPADANGRWRLRVGYIIHAACASLLKQDSFDSLSRTFRFYDKRDAEDALDAMDGRLLDGRELRVQMARYGRPTSPHRSRGSRRRGR